MAICLLYNFLDMERKIIHFDKLNSTNAYGLEHFKELSHGDVITTDIQLKGRGRFDRVWSGEFSDDIYMSIIIKPDNSDFPFPNLTQYLSVVTNRILNRDYGIISNIKWPNDILFEGKKLAGILSEGKIIDNKLSGVVLGIGINVNREVFEDLPNAISLKNIIGKTLDKKVLINKILEEFFDGYVEFASKGFLSIMEEYKMMCRFNGGKLKLTASFNDGEYVFEEINSDGTISVRDERNNIHKIISGDIQC